MRRLLLALVVASLPLAVLAQQGSILRESQPPDDQVEARPLPPDDGIVAVPLLPPDQEMQPDGDALREMVPNPLQDPDAAPAPGGRQAQPGSGFYSATKFAVEGMSDALRKEVKPLGIGVTVVEPENCS